MAPQGPPDKPRLSRLLSSCLSSSVPLSSSPSCGPRLDASLPPPPPAVHPFSLQSVSTPSPPSLWLLPGPRPSSHLWSTLHSGQRALSVSGHTCPLLQTPLVHLRALRTQPARLPVASKALPASPAVCGAHISHAGRFQSPKQAVGISEPSSCSSLLLEVLHSFHPTPPDPASSSTGALPPGSLP